MISFYDLTPLQFVLMMMHVISGILYFYLGVKIMQRKKYLSWNNHIYPLMMVASFGFAVLFLHRLVEQKTYSIAFHILMWTFAYIQYSELFRLVEKYNIIKDFENKTMNKFTTVIILSFLLISCGSRKVEMEKMSKSHQESSQQYEKKIYDLTAIITQREETKNELLKTLEQIKSEKEDLKQELSYLQEKSREDKKEDFLIKNAAGTVKMTDASGNVFDIPSGTGTEISKTSISSLSRELEQKSESLSRATQSNQILTQTVQDKQTEIREKSEQIHTLEEQTKKQVSEIKDLETEITKKSEREAYPVWYWMIAGAVAVLLIQLVWKLYKPNILKLWIKNS